MFWPIPLKDSELQNRLVAISRGQGRLPPDAYFKSGAKPWRLVLFGAASLAGALILALLAVQCQAQENVGYRLFHVPWTLLEVLLAAYGAICLLARIRIPGTGIRPFVLVTPAAILKVDLASGRLQGHRLREATKFEKVMEYTRRQSYSGTAYKFTFPEGLFILREKDDARLQRLDAVLAQARAGKSSGDDPLLPVGGQTKSGFLPLFLDPFSALWVTSWVLIGIALCITVIVLVNR